MRISRVDHLVFLFNCLFFLLTFLIFKEIRFSFSFRCTDTDNVIPPPPFPDISKLDDVGGCYSICENSTATIKTSNVCSLFVFPHGGFMSSFTDIVSQFYGNFFLVKLQF